MTTVMATLQRSSGTWSKPRCRVKATGRKVWPQGPRDGMVPPMATVAPEIVARDVPRIREDGFVPLFMGQTGGFHPKRRLYPTGD